MTPKPYHHESAVARANSIGTRTIGCPEPETFDALDPGSVFASVRVLREVTDRAHDNLSILEKRLEPVLTAPSQHTDMTAPPPPYTSRLAAEIGDEATRVEALERRIAYIVGRLGL